MADCTKCASADSCERVWNGMSNPMCVGYNPAKTNGDKFRSLPNEELAEILANLTNCFDCAIRSSDCYGRCLEHWLDWVKQEAKDEV